MSRVFLIKENFFEKIEPVMKKRLGDIKGKKVAVKVHMGEYGNIYHIRPAVVGRVVEILKDLGGKPFVFDTLVKYRGSRDTIKKYQETARKNGFTAESIGCPILVLDKMKAFRSKNFNLEMPEYAMDADMLMVLSHGKGHWHCAGFGGAIKNIGMGMTSPKSKADIHQSAGPTLVGNCNKCKACVEVCPKDCVVVGKGWRVDIGKCIGCGRCIQVCKEKALAHIIDNFGALMVEPLPIVAKNIPEIFCITALMDITEHCDCNANPGIPKCQDIGFLVSDDPVAIDKAAIDLIEKANPMFFKDMGLEPSDQIIAAGKLGLGSRYSLSVV